MDHNTAETGYPVRYSMEDPIAGHAEDEKGALRILNDVCSEIETVTAVQLRDSTWTVKEAIPYVGPYYTTIPYVGPYYTEIPVYRGVRETKINHLYLNARVKVSPSLYNRVNKYRSDHKWTLSFLIEQALKEYLKGYLEELLTD